jgi:hypothetical protein
VAEVARDGADVGSAGDELGGAVMAQRVQVGVDARSGLGDGIAGGSASSMGLRMIHCHRSVLKLCPVVAKSLTRQRIQVSGPRGTRILNLRIKSPKAVLLAVSCAGQIALDTRRPVLRARWKQLDTGGYWRAKWRQLLTCSIGPDRNAALVTRSAPPEQHIHPDDHDHHHRDGKDQPADLLVRAGGRDSPSRANVPRFRASTAATEDVHHDRTGEPVANGMWNPHAPRSRSAGGVCGSGSRSAVAARRCLF